MTPRKQWFKVLVVTEKTIKIYAADEEEAKQKAEDKCGPRWSAEDAWTEKPQKREPSCTCGHPQCNYCGLEVIFPWQTQST